MTDSLVADSIDNLTKVVKELDFTPSPSKRQFVREAAAKIAPQISGISSDATIVATRAIAIAEEIWEQTRQM